MSYLAIILHDRENSKKKLKYSRWYKLRIIYQRLKILRSKIISPIKNMPSHLRPGIKNKILEILGPNKNLLLLKIVISNL